MMLEKIRSDISPTISAEWDPNVLDFDGKASWTDRTVLVVDPRCCTAAKFVARDPDRPGTDAIQQLIDSFRNEGQLQPVLCRHGGRDADATFEVVMGVRRLLAAQWLCENELPDFKLRIEVIEINDRDAFVMVDRESSAHATLSAIERGRSMHRALHGKLFKSQRELAAALKERPATVSILVRLAEWPSELLEAFDTPYDILMVDAERLGPIVEDAERRGALLQEAERIRRDQMVRRAVGKAPRTRTAVFNALKRSVRPSVSEESVECSFAKLGKLPDGSKALVISIRLPVTSRMKAMSEVRDHIKNFHWIEPGHRTDVKEEQQPYDLLSFIEAQTKDS